jgi:hypothetical protein
MSKKRVISKSVWMIALMLLTINILPAQNTVTLSDGRFTYRLAVEKIPQVHRQYMKESMQTPGQQRARIGFMLGTVKTITIFPVNDSTHKQVIIPGNNESSWPWTEDNKGEKFITEDMNFDGNNDIRLLNSADKFTYYCWIYQPLTGQFAEDTVLDKFVNPQFDQNQRLVYQNWERVNEHSKGTQIYKYIDGVLTLIEEDETINDYDSKTTTTTIRKWANGEMKVVSKTESPLSN